MFTDCKLIAYVLSRKISSYRVRNNNNSKTQVNRRRDWARTEIKSIDLRRKRYVLIHSTATDKRARPNIECKTFGVSMFPYSFLHLHRLRYLLLNNIIEVRW